MGERFRDKVAVVIGGTSGIGRATAERFADEGAAVVIAGRSTEAGAAVAADIEQRGGSARFIAADVTESDALAAVVAGAREAYGRIDCAFNNAGWLAPAVNTGDVLEADWLNMIDVKLNGVWRSMKAEIPAMLEGGGGAIVNMAGNWGLVGFPKYASYCAAAHGIMGLTRAAALEYARAGLRINAVCPGAVDAPMLDRIVGGNEAIKQGFGEGLAIGRLCTAEEVAEAVLWLCSDAASYVNGHALVLDGGG
jgi:NAD(P)-dependent dehydrogenase (short-subunit alcohol dehydrogenase family)